MKCFESDIILKFILAARKGNNYSPEVTQFIHMVRTKFIGSFETALHNLFIKFMNLIMNSHADIAWLLTAFKPMLTPLEESIITAAIIIVRDPSLCDIIEAMPQSTWGRVT